MNIVYCNITYNYVYVTKKDCCFLDVIDNNDQIYYPLE